MRSTSPTLRREWRVATSVFDFLLDASLRNTYAVMKAHRIDGSILPDFRDYGIVHDVASTVSDRTATLTNAVYSD